MLVGEGALFMINEEGGDLVLCVGKEAATLHGYFRVTTLGLLSSAYLYNGSEMPFLHVLQSPSSGISPQRPIRAPKASGSAEEVYQILS